MQHDLDHILRKEQQRRRIRIIVIFLLFAALMLAFMWTCSSKFGDEYNQGYHPFDEERLKQLEQGK